MLFRSGFGIFRNSENRFRFFSVGFIGIGIFRNRYRLSEFKFGIGIEIGTVFYRRFYRIPILIGILPDPAVGIFETKATFQPTQPTQQRAAAAAGAGDASSSSGQVSP